MLNASRVAGIFVILAFLCAAAVFIIEEVRYIPAESEFSVYEPSCDAIDINTATKEELVALSGIGEVMAERIIKHRNERKFESLYDLTLVRGMGESVIEKNIGRIKVD